jgi:protein-tyrosine phosphatase
MNESEFLEQLVNKYYEHLKDNEKVVVACAGYRIDVENIKE